MTPREQRLTHHQSGDSGTSDFAGLAPIHAKTAALALLLVAPITLGLGLPLVLRLRMPWYFSTSVPLSAESVFFLYGTCLAAVGGLLLAGVCLFLKFRLRRGAKEARRFLDASVLGLVRNRRLRLRFVMACIILTALLSVHLTFTFALFVILLL